MMAKLQFLRCFKIFNKKQSNSGGKQASSVRRRSGCNRSSSCSTPVNGVNTSSNAVLVAVFAGAKPPGEEKKNSSHHHRSQYQELLDEPSRGSLTCSNVYEDSSSVHNTVPHHGPNDVDTSCQLFPKKNNNSNNNNNMNVNARSRSDTVLPVAMDPAPLKIVESLPSQSRLAFDRYTNAESYQQDIDLQSSFFLRSTTEHELKILRPSAGGNIGGVPETKLADNTERASTPEKGDLLQKHQDECDPSPTSVFQFDSTHVVDVDKISVPCNWKRGNNITSAETSQLPSSSERIDMNERTTSSVSYQSMISSLMSPPEIIRHMPAAIFGNTTDTLSSMWNLDDIASSSTTSTSSAAKEFLALKKDAEKNEFKKVMQLQQHKKSAVPPSPVAVQDGTRKRSGMEEPHETIEIQVNQDANPPSSLSTVSRPDIPSNTDEGMYMPSIPSHSPSNVIVDIIQPSGSQHYLDDMQPDDGTYSDDTCSYDSEFDTIGEITICSETKRLMEAHQLYEDAIKSNVNHPGGSRKGILKVKMPIKEIYIEGEKNLPDSGSVSIRTESIKTEMSFPMDDNVSLPSIETQQRKKITWYDDEAHWNKPFTLRTDESFDASTISNSRVSIRSGYSQNIKQYNVVDQLLGDFIKGIGKYTCFDDEAATSFDVAEQQEI